MRPHQTTTRQVLGLVVAMLIAGVATLAARRLHWPDMLVALGLGLLLAPTLRGARWTAGLTFASRTVLRAGIALLEFRVTLAQLATRPSSYASRSRSSVRSQ